VIIILKSIYVKPTQIMIFNNQATCRERMRSQLSVSPHTIKVLFRATRVPYAFAEKRPICISPADSAAHLLPCIGSFLKYSQGKPTGLVSCRRLGSTEPQERNRIDRYIETNVITGHQRRNTGAIIKTDTWPKLMRSNIAFFPFLSLDHA
jgi:hypothetical protein